MTKERSRDGALRDMFKEPRNKARLIFALRFIAMLMLVGGVLFCIYLLFVGR